MLLTVKLINLFCLLDGNSLILFPLASRFSSADSLWTLLISSSLLFLISRLVIVLFSKSKLSILLLLTSTLSKTLAFFKWDNVVILLSFATIFFNLGKLETTLKSLILVLFTVNCSKLSFLRVDNSKPLLLDKNKRSNSFLLLNASNFVILLFSRLTALKWFKFCNAEISLILLLSKFNDSKLVRFFSTSIFSILFPAAETNFKFG